MNIGRAGEKLARKLHNIPTDTYPMRANGQLLSHDIHTFAAKFGFALHHEVNGEPVPAAGGVQVMWFSNVQALDDQIPQMLVDVLPSPSLQEGAKSVNSKFVVTSPGRNSSSSPRLQADHTGTPVTTHCFSLVFRDLSSEPAYNLIVAGFFRRPAAVAYHSRGMRHLTGYPPPRCSLRRSTTHRGPYGGGEKDIAPKGTELEQECSRHRQYCPTSFEERT